TYGAPSQPDLGLDPHQAPQQAYTSSGLTAADLRFTPADQKRSGGAWKLVAAVAGAVVLIAGAAVGGYVVRDLQGDGPSGGEAAATTRTASEVQKALGGDGFECAEAFQRPVRVDQCYREGAEYREGVGFQLLDQDRISWLKIRVESNDAEDHPVKDRALEVFGRVLDESLPGDDADPAKVWLKGNFPTDYTKSEYLVHEAGSVRLQMLPRENEMALLWVRLTAATYQSQGEEQLPRVNATTMEREHTAADFSCTPSEASVSCDKSDDAGDLVVGYGVDDDNISAVRLTATPTGELDEIAPAAKEHTTTLLGMMLAGQELDTATKWAEGAFDDKPHRTVVSGLDLSVHPVVSPGEGRTYYQVDVLPAGW
ncbi:MAG: hypothetical protein ACRDT1_16610, partial [Micromonosporaceae bacterium]